ncbi:MAG: DUF2157 domain-containing protein [Marinicella sp.]
MSESIYQWIKSGLVKPEYKQKALELAGERPSGTAWLQFSKQVLISLGLLSLAIGVVFFFAYNWNELGRSFKFMILQLLLVMTFLAYFLKSGNKVLAQALLLAGVIVLGALLALFGQTYQTGADPWQLFATWAVMILPLVIFAKSEALWVFWALLTNTGLTLYMYVNPSFFGMVFLSRQIPWLYLVVNGLLLVLLEWLSNKQAPQKVSLTYRWAAQVVGLAVLYALTMIAMEVVWRNDNQFISGLLYLVAMSGFFAYYRFVKKDLMLLTGWCLALIIFILALLAETVFSHMDAGGMLLMALTLIGLTTVAVTWIKKTHEQFKLENDHE